MRLPFKDGCFDVCFEKDALHHIDNPEMSISEMARVSKSQLLVIEANRFNPLSYVTMVKIGKHDHFSLPRLNHLLRKFQRTQILSIETHYYPTKSPILTKLLLCLQTVLEMLLPVGLRNYNIAIVLLD
jgi:ubiquinone/menaquinone biosynthesis C-methylase UbiE